MDPARALVLTSSPPNDTVVDFSPILKLADSLLKLALLCPICPLDTST